MIKSSKIYNSLKCVAVFLDVLYILWILYNGIDEGFKATLVMTVVPLGLVVLLILNIILLRQKRAK